MQLTRPQMHFTPPAGWMNDPNGLVYLNGEYHLFYQHNPFGLDWGHMSWGHAVSKDLMHWEHLPVALPETGGVMNFSGTIVVDEENCSGLGDGITPLMVAFFTGFDPERNIQDQRMATSLDYGRSWQFYSDNPIIDLNESDFRDPKVFWHEETGKWVMVVALSVKRTLQFYTSSNLINWECVGDFSVLLEADGIWECPDLFPMQHPNGEQKWVLIISISEGVIAGGSGVVYFVGDFNGRSFVPNSQTPQLLDYGPDFYAVASWNHAPDERRIILGWMSHLQYANVIPAATWRGQQSLPRTLNLRKNEEGYFLQQRPIADIQSTQKIDVQINDHFIAENQPVEADLATLPLEMRVVLRLESAPQIRFFIANKLSEGVTIRYEWGSGMLTLDCSGLNNTSFHPKFAAVYNAPLDVEDEVVELRLFLDSCSLELFAGNGRVVFSALLFWQQLPNKVTITTDDRISS